MSQGSKRPSRLPRMGGGSAEDLTLQGEGMGVGNSIFQLRSSEDFLMSGWVPEWDQPMPHPPLPLIQPTALNFRHKSAAVGTSQFSALGQIKDRAVPAEDRLERTGRRLDTEGFALPAPRPPPTLGAGLLHSLSHETAAVSVHKMEAVVPKMEAVVPNPPPDARSIFRVPTSESGLPASWTASPRREPAPLPSLSRPAGALAAWSTHPIHSSPGGVRRAPSTSFDPRSVRTGADVAQLLLGEEPLPPDTPCVFYLNLAEWRGAPASSLAQGWYRPYDLVVVPRAATSPEHFTITASGVTHLRPEQPSEVTPLAVWLRHRALFAKLREIRFFGSFALSKTFRRWRRNVRKRVFSYARNYVALCHLQLTHQFGAALRQVARQVDDINQDQTDEEWVRQADGSWREVKREGWEHGLVTHHLATTLGHLGPDSTVTTKEFAAAREEASEEASAFLCQVVEAAGEVVAAVGRDVAAEAGECMPPPLTNKESRAKRFELPDRKQQWREESMFLIRMEKRDQRFRWRRGAWLMQMLGRFLRLVDMLFVAKLVDLGAAAVSEFRRSLQMPRRAGLFLVEGHIVSEEADPADTALDLEMRRAILEKHDLREGAVYEPSMDDTCRVLEGVVHSIANILGSVPRLVTDPKLVHLLGPAGKPPLQTVAALVRVRVGAEEETARAASAMREAYTAALNSDTAMVLRDAGVMFAFTNSWSAQEYQKRNPTADDFCTDLAAVRQWQEDLTKRARNQVMFGLVHVDVARLKQQLLAPASRVLDGMTSLLQGAFQRHCELVAEDLQTDARWLAQKPSELVEFAAFVREARTHLPAGARATQAEADQHTTIKFSELLGPSGMAAAANPIAVTRRASQDDEDGYSNYRRNSYSDELDEASGGTSNDMFVEMLGLFNNYFSAAHQCNLYIQETMPTMVAALKKCAKVLEEEMRDVLLSLRSGTALDVDVHPRQVKEHLGSIGASLARLGEAAKEARAHQQLFSSPPLVDMDRLERDATALLAERVRLWESLGQWEQFLQKVEDTDIVFTRLIHWDEVEREIAAVDATVEALQALPATADKLLITHATPDEQEFARTLRERVDRWKGYMPMLQKLCHPALQVHHWAALLQQLGLMPKNDEDRVSLAQLLRAGVLDAPQLVEAVWTQATEEAKLIDKLNRTEAFWEEAELAHAEAATFGFLPIVNLEALLEQISASQDALEAMLASPYLMGVVERYEQVESYLLVLQQSLSNGHACQQQWLFLCRLFSRKQERHLIHAELARFETLRAMWGRSLVQVQEQPQHRKLQRACLPGGVLSECEELARQMTEIRNSCHDVMDHLRFSFPRFNFIGDQELLTLAASSGNPSNINAAVLAKMFPAVASFVCEEIQNKSRVQVLGWRGVNGETVLLDAPVSSTKDQTWDVWLRELEEAARTSLRHQCKASLKGSASMLVSEWVGAFPRQCSLLVDQVVWTDLVHGALHDTSQGQASALRGLYEQNVARVEFLARHMQRGTPAAASSPTDSTAAEEEEAQAEAPSTPDAKDKSKEKKKRSRAKTPLAAPAELKGEELLRELQQQQEAAAAAARTREEEAVARKEAARAARRVTAGTFADLLVSAVMHREVVAELVRDGYATSEASYEWLEHLRHYWDPDVDQCSVGVGHAKMQYAFEYLGKGPLCRRTPCNSRHFMAAGAAMAPGGVVSLLGNDEAVAGLQTAEALAQACGRLLVPMTWAPLSSFSLLDRVLAGLARIGAWGCILQPHTAPATASLLSQRLVEIHQVIHTQSETVTFQGVECRPDPAFVCFLAAANSQRIAPPPSPAPAHPAHLMFTADGEAHLPAVPLPLALRRASRSVCLQPLDTVVVMEAAMRRLGLPGARSVASDLAAVLKLLAAQLPPGKPWEASVLPRAMQGVVRYLCARLASLAETLEQPIHECLTVSTSYSLVAQAVTAVVAPSFPVLYAGVLLSTMRVVFDASQRRIAAKAGAHAPVSRLGTPQAPPHEPAHSPKVRFVDPGEVDVSAPLAAVPSSPTLAPEPESSGATLTSTAAATSLNTGGELGRLAGESSEGLVARRAEDVARRVEEAAHWLREGGVASSTASLLDCVKSVCADKFAFSHAQVTAEKAVGLYEQLQSHRAVFLLGQAGCGKTTCYQALAEGLRKWSDARGGTAAPATARVVYPQALSEAELLGHYLPSTLAFQEGVLAGALGSNQLRAGEARAASSSPPRSPATADTLERVEGAGEEVEWSEHAGGAAASSGEGCWVVLDGCISAVLGDVLVPLASGKPVLMPNGEYIEMKYQSEGPPHYDSQLGTNRLLLECTSLACYSPSVMSVAGIFNVHRTHEPDLVRLQEVLSQELVPTQRHLWEHGYESAMGSMLEVRSTLDFIGVVLDYRRTNILQGHHGMHDVWHAQQTISLFKSMLVDDSQERLMQRSRVSAMPNGSVLLKQRVRLSFVMAMLWVLGGGMTEKEQAQLEDAIRILTGGLCMAQTADGGYVSLLPDPPARLMDHRVCPSTCALVPWLPEDVPQGLEVDVAEDGALLSLRGVSQLVVPSASLAAFAYMLDRLVRSGGHVLVLGAGTWVTTNLTRHVLHHLPAQKFVALNTSLSACTSPAELSGLVKERLHQRRSAVMRPRVGQRTVVLVDDVHVPCMACAHRRSGHEDQHPALEWMRQVCDSGTLFDASKASMCRIPGTQLVASATPEYTIRGSSRSLMSKRLVRHMCVLTVATGTSSAREQDYYFTAQALTSMLQHGMRSMVGESDVVQEGIDGAVKALLTTVQSLRTVVGSVMNPTPDKAQVLSIGVLARVVQGMIRVVKHLDVEETLSSTAGEAGDGKKPHFSSHGGAANFDKRHMMSSPMGLFARAWRHEVERELLDSVADAPALASQCLQAMQSGIDHGFPGFSGAMKQVHGQREIFAPLSSSCSPSLVDMDDVKTRIAALLESKKLEDAANRAKFADDSEWFTGGLPYGAVIHVTKVARVLKYQWELGHVVLVGRSAGRRHATLLLAAGLLGMSHTVLGSTRSATSASTSASSSSQHLDYSRAELLKEIASTFTNKMKYGHTNDILFVAPEAVTARDELLEALHQVVVSGSVAGLKEEWASHKTHTVYGDSAFLGEAGASAKGADIFEAEMQQSQALDQLKRQVRFAFVMTPERFHEVRALFPALLQRCGVTVVRDPTKTELSEICQHVLAPLKLTVSAAPTAAGTPSPEPEASHLKGITPPAEMNLAMLSAELHTSALACFDAFHKELGRRVHVPPSKHVEMLKLVGELFQTQKKSLWLLVAGLKVTLLKMKEAEAQKDQCKQAIESLQPVLEARVRENAKLLAEISEREVGAEALRSDIALEQRRMDDVQTQIQHVDAKAREEMGAAIERYKESMEQVMALAKEDIAELKSFNKPPGLVKIVMEAVCILFQLQPDWETAQVMLNDVDFVNKMEVFEQDKVADVTVRRLQSYVRNKNFRPEAVEQVSKAARSLCVWVLAVDQYAKVASNVSFRAGKLKEAQEKVDMTRGVLDKKSDELEDMQRAVASMQAQHKVQLSSQQVLEDERAHTSATLQRIRVLTDKFAEQREEWLARQVKAEAVLRCLVGDVLLAAASLTYLGPLSEQYRRSLTREWVACAQGMSVPVDPDFSVERFFAYRDASSKRVPGGAALDPLTAESLMLITHSHKWPLLIDPDGEGVALLRRLRPPGQWKDLNIADPNAEDLVTMALESGTSVLLQVDLENLPMTFLSRLLGLASKLLSMDSRPQGAGKEAASARASSLIPIGVYLYTLAPNPVLAAELVGKVNVVNMSLGAERLEHRLMQAVLNHMQPKAEATWLQLDATRARAAQIVQESQAKLVTYISNCDGQVWDDDTLMQTLLTLLTSAAATARELQQTLDQQAQIRQEHEPFLRVAQIGCTMFSVLVELGNHTPRFVVPFAVFAQIFNQCLAAADLHTLSGRQRNAIKKLSGGKIHISTAADDAEVKVILVSVIRGLYARMCQRLLRADASALGFLLAVRFLLISGSIPIEEFDFLLDLGVDLSGASSPLAARHPPSDDQQQHEEPPEELEGQDPLLTPEVLKQVYALEVEYPDKEAFLGLKSSLLVTHAAQWSRCLRAHCPLEALPGNWGDRITDFQRVVLMRVLYPRKFVTCAEWLVSRYLGPWEEASQSSRLMAAGELAGTVRPVVVHAHDGEDAAACLAHAAKVAGVEDRVEFYALGQNRSADVDQLVLAAMKDGAWLVLLNAETEAAWLHQLVPVLSRVDLPPGVALDPNFRLWVCVPSAAFHLLPGAMMTAAVVVAVEPPRGMQACLLRSYESITPREPHFDLDTVNSDLYQKHVFALAMFVSMVNGRGRKLAGRSPGVPPLLDDSDFLAGVRALHAYFLPESIKRRDDLNRALKNPGFDYGDLHRVVMRVVCEPHVVDQWERRELEAVLARCMGVDILTKLYFVFPLPANHNKEWSNANQVSGADRAGMAMMDAAEGGDQDAKIFPWGHGMSRYREFILEILPNGASVSGPLGLDTAHELRFGASAEAVAMGVRRASRAFLLALTQAARPLTQRPPSVRDAASLLQQDDAAALANVMTRTSAALAASLASLIKLETTANTLREQEEAQWDRRSLWIPIWQGELQGLQDVVAAALDDLQLGQWALDSHRLCTTHAATVLLALSSKQVPESWDLSRPSAVRELDAWLKEVQSRTAFLRARFQLNPEAAGDQAMPHLLPLVHAPSSYINPQAVFNAFLLQFASEAMVDVGRVEFEMKFQHTHLSQLPPVEGPGLYITGLQMFGAQWDRSHSVLAELDKEVEFGQLPAILLTPKEKSHTVSLNDQLVEVPLYQAHMLEQNDFVRPEQWLLTSFRLKTRRQPDVWVQRGIAVYCHVSERL